MEKEKYQQITNEEVKNIIKNLIKKCDTNPKDIAQFIYRNGNVIGNFWNIKYNLEKINELKQQQDEEEFKKFYLEFYDRLPTDYEVYENYNHCQYEIDYYENALKSCLLSDSVFYDINCKILKFNDGLYNKIFTPKQVELIYKTIEKYVIDNKKYKVIFADLDSNNYCIEGIRANHLNVVREIIFKYCNLQKILKIYEKAQTQLNNVDFENKLREKVFNEGTIKDLLAYLIIKANTYTKTKKEKTQLEENNKEIADKIFKLIKEQKDKKTCKIILLGLNNSNKSDSKSQILIDYFDAKELLKTYIDMCTKKEIEDFIAEIKHNKHEADYPPDKSIYNDDYESC